MTLPEKADISSFELARYFVKSIKFTDTIRQYKEFLKSQDKQGIATMVYHRLHARYIKPFLYPDSMFKKEYKNNG